MAPLSVPDRFGRWLRSSWRRLAIPPLTIGIPALLTFINNLRPLQQWPWLKPTSVALHLLTIISLLMVFPHPLVDRSKSRRATVAAEQFSHWWRLLWVFWMVEYVILLGREIYKDVPHAPLDDWAAIIGATALNFGNNLPTLALLMCYYITTIETVRELDGDIEPRRIPWESPLALLVLLTIAELLVRANAAVYPHVVGSLTSETAAIFDWISGIAAGLATALLVGRLDSRFISLSPAIITLLYVYAVIQAAWPTFGDNPTIRIVIVNLALALKILFFAVVYWLFRSGVMLYYLEKIADVYKQSPAERQEFLSRLQRNLTAA